MATIDTISGTAVAKIQSPAKPTWLRANWGVLLAVAALVAVLWLPTPEGLSIAGQRMLAVLAFAVINAPQNMVAYGTETFEAKDFVRTGLVLTMIALALVMLLGMTYWRWLGYV